MFEAKTTMERYHEINALTYEEWQKKCVSCNDCSRCKMALYKDLYSSTKSTCVYDMPIKTFKIEVEMCDAYMI